MYRTNNNNKYLIKYLYYIKQLMVVPKGEVVRKPWISVDFIIFYEKYLPDYIKY